MTDINIDGIITWLSDWFQDKLVSGSNIKTINNQSLLGSGNISISGGGGNIDNQLDVNSTNPVQNSVIATEFNKIGEIDNVTDIYGDLIRLDDVYDYNDAIIIGKLVYSLNEDKLYYRKLEDNVLDEIATKEDIPSVPSMSWQSVTVTTGTLKVNTALKLAYFEFGKQLSVTTANSLYTVTANNIPSTYRPKRAVRFPCANTQSKFAVIDNNGNLGIVSNSTSSLTYNGDTLWHYGE